MISLELRVYAVGEAMPDADTDVLIFDGTSPEGQLGAYVGVGDAGTLWADAQGSEVAGVTHWAEMPLLPMQHR